jgi:hypothetical protein
VAVPHLGRCRPVRLHTGVNQCSVKVGYGSMGVMLLEYRTVILHSGKLRPLGRGMDYLQQSVSSYRGSSSDVMGPLPPRLKAELGTEVWQEHGCPRVSALCLRCTSSAWCLSSMCLRVSTTA